MRVDHCLHTHATCTQGGSDPALRFPPYTATKVLWLKRLRSLTVSSLLKGAAAVVIPVVAAGAYYYTAAKL